MVRVIRVHKRVYESDAKQARGEKKGEKEMERKEESMEAGEGFVKQQHRLCWTVRVLMPVLCIYYVMLTSVHKRSFVTTCYYTDRTSLQIGLFKEPRDKLELLR